MDTENWLPISAFPDYEVSNLGRVRSLKRYPARILKPWAHNSGGYPAVKLSIRGQPQQSVLVHQVVCHEFHGPKPTIRHEVAHSDGRPANCREDNLRWALPVENIADKIRHGTHFNSGQFQARLTEEDVREIRTLLSQGLTQTEVAKRFGVVQGTVSGIKLGRLFRHIT